MYVWDFGDGTTSTVADPGTHTYSSSGTYVVCLTAINSCGTEQYCDTVNITCPLPVAQFSVTDTLYEAQFTNTSTNADSWLWQFGDGQTATDSNATHSYSQAGTFTACLIVTNNCGSDTLCTDVVIDCPGPISSFSFTNEALTSSFVSTATNADSLFWDFGDGSTNTGSAVEHEFAEGLFSVCLTAVNACGSSMACSEVAPVGFGASLPAQAPWKLFPNPARESVLLSGPTAQYRLVSADGKSVLQGHTQRTRTIDLTGLSEGVYWLHIGLANPTILPLLIQR